MKRIALVCSETIRPNMAGIGIRYTEFARRLASCDVETVLIAPGRPEDTPDGITVFRPCRGGTLGKLTKDCDAAVAQGQLANDLIGARPDLPLVIDLYDPWLVENMHYYGQLGLGPYNNDLASWKHQAAHGDFFICSSEEQRLFYLGFLLAMDRVRPEQLEQDPDYRKLIDAVPFGVPPEPPAHNPWLPPADDGEKRILFGGLYDWYDPWPLLEAVEQSGRSNWKILFVRNPNPENTPQGLMAEVIRWTEADPRREAFVQFIEWVPAERRYDLFMDADVLVSPHQPMLETRLSLRTRFLEALASGCPVITSEGGTISRLLKEHQAGIVVPTGNPGALLAALENVLENNGTHKYTTGARALVSEFHWDKVLAPLESFCRNPQKAAR